MTDNQAWQALVTPDPWCRKAWQLRNILYSLSPKRVATVASDGMPVFYDEENSRQIEESRQSPDFQEASKLLQDHYRTCPQCSAVLQEMERKARNLP